MKIGYSFLRDILQLWVIKSFDYTQGVSKSLHSSMNTLLYNIWELCLVVLSATNYNYSIVLESNGFSSLALSKYELSSSETNQGSFKSNVVFACNFMENVLWTELKTSNGNVFNEYFSGRRSYWAAMLAVNVKSVNMPVE